MSEQVNGVSAVGAVAATNTTTGTAKSEQVDVKFPNKTEAYKKSLEHLQTAKEKKLAYLDAEIRIAENTGKPKEVARLKELKQSFIDIYKNTNYKISDTGEVTFSFTPYANFNVEDFKQAYGLKNGSLRRYLRGRHNEDVASGRAGIDSADIVTTNWFKTTTTTVKPVDYEKKKANIEAEDMHSTPNENKLYDDFLNHKGSVVNYSDGMKKICEHGLWSGRNFGSPDYSGMYLSDRDKFTIAL